MCHETIYQALYTGRSGLSRTLTARLRTGRALRQRRRRALERTPRYLVPSRLIDARPAVVETRSRCGDWEGDLIVGTASRSAIGTVVDRKSRYLHLVHLPDGHTAGDLVVGLRATMGTLAANLRFTLTWDQGSEMAAHDRIGDLFDEGVFFAHAGKPWQRGSNENTNGLLRQYFPKGTDLRIHSAATLQDVAQRLNNRPRKTLGWRTPAEVFQTAVPPNTSQRCDDRSNPPSNPPGATGSEFTRHRQRGSCRHLEVSGLPPRPGHLPHDVRLGSQCPPFRHRPDDAQVRGNVLQEVATPQALRILHEAEEPFEP